MQTPMIWEVYSTFFDSSVKKGATYVKLMRASFNLAGPIEHNGIRYADKSDRRQEQRLVYREYQLDLDDYLIEQYP